MLLTLHAYKVSSPASKVKNSAWEFPEFLAKKLGNVAPTDEIMSNAIVLVSRLGTTGSMDEFILAFS